MRQKLRSLVAQDFIKHNIVFFIGTLLISVFNYLYYPVIGRLVSVADFGEIQAVISLFFQLGVVLTAFGYVITNMTNNQSKDTDYKRNVALLERVVLVVCIALFMILCALSFMLQSTLQFSSITPIILVGLLVILNVPSTSRSFYLQGMRRLREVSVSGIIYAAGKLAISVLLIALFANDVVMVVVAYLIAQLLTLLYLVLKTPSLKSQFYASISIWRVRHELIYGLAIVALLSGITILYASDVIAVRFFFDPIEAGLYSGVSAVARIVFFVTASVAGVLIATIKMKDKYSVNLKTLKKSIILVSIIGGLTTLVFALTPTFSVSVLLGGKYAEAASLLPILAVLMLVCSYNNLLICFEIALRRFKVIYIVASGIVIGGAVLLLFHRTLIDIVFAYLAANVLICMLLSIQIVMRKNNA